MFENSRNGLDKYTNEVILNPVKAFKNNEWTGHKNICCVSSITEKRRLINYEITGKQSANECNVCMGELIEEYESFEKVE